MKKRLASIVLVILFIIPLSACGGGVEKIRLAEVTHSVFYAPLYVAIEKEFFKEEGLDVELKTTWGGDKTMTAILSNGADIGLVGSETSIYVYAQEANDPVINFAHPKITFTQDKTTSRRWACSHLLFFDL